MYVIHSYDNWFTHTVPPLFQGYKQKKVFIIAQGPLENTCGHFWQMIQQYKCATIVMLSDIMEYKQVSSAAREELYEMASYLLCL